MSNLDPEDFMCGGLPSDEELHTESLHEDYEWLNSCVSLITKHSVSKYLDSSVMLHLATLEHITKQTDIKAGAVLLTLVDLTTSEIKDQWIPKKLVANLDPVARTIWVWEVFANEHLSNFFKAPEESSDE